MKTLLILLLSTLSLFGYAQTREYYKKDGDITVSTKNRSLNSAKYKCKNLEERVRIDNINNKLSEKAPLKKDGSELNGDVPDMVIVEDPEIFYKISAKVFAKYGFEIYTRKEWLERKNIDDYLNSFRIMTSYDSSNGKVLEVMFLFSTKENRYASYLPIETYAEIEDEIKKQVKVTVNEEGKTRIFCRQIYPIFFKKKDNL